MPPSILAETANLSLFSFFPLVISSIILPSKCAIIGKIAFSAAFLTSILSFAAFCWMVFFCARQIVDWDSKKSSTFPPELTTKSVHTCSKSLEEIFLETEVMAISFTKSLANCGVSLLGPGWSKSNEQYESMLVFISLVSEENWSSVVKSSLWENCSTLRTNCGCFNLLCYLLIIRL